MSDGLASFLTVRPRLVGIASRILPNAGDAEDLVQDVWVRWQRANRATVRDAAAFLTTTVTRLAINVIQSARMRRESACGPPLPESVYAAASPESQAERRLALSRALRLLLETLTPVERAAYILREAFDYSYRDVARALRLEEAHARQLVLRARRRVVGVRRRPASFSAQRRLLDAFTAASDHGNVTSLEGFLAAGPAAQRKGHRS